MKSKSIPLIRFAFFVPFAEELQSRGHDVGSLLDQVGLRVEAPDAAEFLIPANVMYLLAESAAKMAGDPFLGATMGSRFDLLSSSLFGGSSTRSVSLGDCLFHFVRASQDHASSQRYGLLIKGYRAVLFGERTFAPSCAVGQADAWDAAVWTTLIRQSTGDKWDPLAISVRISDPGVIPESLLPAASLLRGDSSGCSFTFPADWLDAEVLRKGGSDVRSGTQVALNGKMESLVRHVLTRSDLRADIKIDRIARSTGIHPRKLQRALREDGTSFSRLLDDEKRLRAVQAIQAGEQPIASVAASVGFSDPANFNRAFRRWTGQSPSEFLRRHKNGDRAP